MTIEEIDQLHKDYKNKSKEAQKASKVYNDNVSLYVKENAVELLKDMNFFMTDYGIREFKGGYKYSFEPVQLKSVKRHKTLEKLFKQFDLCHFTFDYKDLKIQISLNAYNSNSIGLDIRRNQEYESADFYEEERDSLQLEYLTNVMNFLNEFNIKVEPHTYSALMETIRNRIDRAENIIKEYEDANKRNAGLFSLVNKYIFRKGE